MEEKEPNIKCFHEVFRSTLFFKPVPRICSVEIQDVEADTPVRHLSRQALHSTQSTIGTPTEFGLEQPD